MSLTLRPPDQHALLVFVSYYSFPHPPNILRKFLPLVTTENFCSSWGENVETCFSHHVVEAGVRFIGMGARQTAS